MERTDRRRCPSDNDHFGTPDRVFDLLEGQRIMARSYFDPCPMHSKFDGLTINWKEQNFINPPYSLLPEFVEKSFKENQNGKYCVLLLPVKTDQDWFHDIICKWYYNNVMWIRGRLKFVNQKSFAGQAHMLVVMN